jgi:hypothetical protein
MRQMLYQGRIKLEGIHDNSSETKSTTSPSLQKGCRQRTYSRTRIQQPAATFSIWEKACHECSRHFRREKLTEQRLFRRFGALRQEQPFVFNR